MRSKSLRDLDYLEHIANRIARVERATSSMELADFLNDEKTEPQQHTQSKEDPSDGKDLGR